MINNLAEEEDDMIAAIVLAVVFSQVAFCSLWGKEHP